jgi:NitT/TauT family transport system ATP-binding protein
MATIELDRVSRDFATPDGRVYRAIADISLIVRAGAFVAIVGPSGCGKSTLLNVVAGLLAPTTGTVRVDGAPLAGINRQATYLFQQDALLPWKTVRDNVALGLTLGGVARADAHARAGAWLARVGLAAFAAHYPSQLSGGMRKRVAMAQNWIIDRGIVLMDEPFSALDVHTRQRMESELLALWEGRSAESGRPADSLALPRAQGGARAGAFQASDQRKTILFVTHDLEEAISLADEVVVLSAGPAARVVAQHAVTLDRPRDLMELRTLPAFVDMYRAIWVVLREEVIKSQRAAEATRG